MTRPLVLRNVGAVATMAADHGLGVVSDVDIVVVDGVIDHIGAGVRTPDDAVVIDAGGRAVVPGFVDCHTHAVFCGDRADEFARRARGEDYLAIAAAGGGIKATMRAVRAASVDELVASSAPRLSRMLRRGATTVEIKSGYGLSVADELKMLQAAKALMGVVDVDVSATLLAAHAVPPEAHSAQAWIDTIISELLPEVSRQGLAEACDIFIEKGAFSVDDGRRLLSAAADVGLAPVIHAEQLSHQGGARLAAELSARRAGHLDVNTHDDAAALAKAGVVAEVLSVAHVYLRGQRPVPGRTLRDAGCAVAIGTDVNPGTAMCDDLCLAAGLAVTQGGLSADEALWAMTAGSARALGKDDRGVIAVGRRADLVIVDDPSPYALVYRWAEPLAHTVIRGGRVVAQRS